ncbi:pentapeptide repeat-containing protein [Haliangium sp.]|uniref:pentapeptide repeat-containing protein n=1 Tax=Haliangium sp. TaxID=2663208 RepID=UPI003D099039
MPRSILERVQNVSHRDVLLILVGFAVGTSVGSVVTHQMVGSGDLLGWLDGWLQNVSTEMFGGFVTFVLIEVLIVGRREREARQRESERHARMLERERRERQKRLLNQMASRIHAEAVRAVEELRELGWVEDGTLEGAKLSRASLSEAPLARARLANARCYGADLRRASLFRADLRGAALAAADLRGAKLGQAEVSGAFLQGAKLDGVTGLRDAQLARAARLKGATMPDGERYDGRYRLPGDLDKAVADGHDRDDPVSMAGFYGVSRERYLAGQRWADRRLRALTDPGSEEPDEGSPAP